MDAGRIVLYRACYVLLVLLLMGEVSWAQDSLAVDRLVVTGTRYAVPIEKSGKSIYKLSADDLSQQAGKSLSDLLNTVPGIHIDGNFGTPGSNISYTARGGRSRQVVILIDGVPMTDPSGIEAFYDLRFLSTDQIQSVEVVKGGLSTLYGAGATAAVINITLKKAATRPLGGIIDMHGGAYGTYGGSINLSGTSGRSSYLLTGGVEDSEGMSAALSNMGTNIYDNDGFRRINGMLKYDYRWTDAWEIAVLGMINDFETEYDDGPFSDADNLQLADEYRIGIAPSYTYGDGEVQLKNTYGWAGRSFESSFPTSYRTYIWQGDLSHEHRFSNLLKGFWGLQWQRMSYSQQGIITEEESLTTMIDPYASLVLDMAQGLNIQAGMRVNTHSNYGSKAVYNINPSFLVALGGDHLLKLQASLASSYNTPSLYQLHTPFFGNADLEPEDAINWEVGASLYLSKNFTFNASFFNRRETNSVVFESQYDEMGNFIGGHYANVEGERGVKGIELDMAYQIGRQWSITANYTQVISDISSSLYRIPRDKVVGGVGYAPSPSTTIRLDYNHTGRRRDFDFLTSKEIELEGYHLLDIYIQQLLWHDRLTIYASINNILDTDFVGVYGFTTRGRNGNSGLRWRF